MRKSTIVTILLIYLASIVAIGFLGTRVRVYGEIRLVSSIEIKIKAANKDSYQGPSPLLDADGNQITDDATGYKIYNMRAFFKQYSENGALELQFIPTFTFKDGTTEEMMGKAVSYQIAEEGYVNQGWISVTADGVLTMKRPTLSVNIYIKPISTEKISAISDSGILLKLSVR